MYRPPLVSRTRYLAAVFALLAPAAVASGEESPLVGAAAEQFLRTARVTLTEEIPIGVTDPQRLTLTDGTRTARAVWKTIDEYAPVKEFHDGRPAEIGFRDSWKHELAAYELDKLLGLNLVPPTVARRIRGREGALQLWIEDARTETDRRAAGDQPPEAEAWNRQIYTVRLLRQLTHDTDFNNTGNLLVTADYRVWAIDHSRAFKIRRNLIAPDDLARFPAALLERLRRLTAAELEQATDDWLTRRQRETLLARRDRIVARADRLVAEQGAAAVLFD